MRFKGHGHISKPGGTEGDSWRTYTCGYCGTLVAGAVAATYQQDGRRIYWLACTACVQGSVESDGRLSPGAEFGPRIDGLPKDVEEAYSETRRCMQVSAFTASELLCRKILMHVAVEKGAPEGDTFAAYLSYLETAGYVTPPMKKWVDLIRQNGNASTHRIASPSRDRAESTVMFTAELLRLVYEMEAMASKYAGPP